MRTARRSDRVPLLAKRTKQIPHTACAVYVLTAIALGAAVARADRIKLSELPPASLERGLAAEILRGPAAARLRTPPGERPELPWTSGLAAGLREAAEKNKPVLVRVLSDSCPWCRRLAAEMRDDEAQKALADWTLVEIVTDRQAEDAAQLEVGPVPALRVLTADGQQVAAHEGFLAADELAAWLRGSAKLLAAGELFSGDGPPDADALRRLLAALAHRSAAVREKAIARLLPHVQAAGGPVADLVLEPTVTRLSARLAALELLESWGAPVGGLDPWRHEETLTPQRRKALEAWRQAASRAAAPGPRAKLTAEELAEARRDIARMLKAPSAEAGAIAQRLVRVGPALLPEVRGQIHATAADQDRQALLTLRYRLAASRRVGLDWPGGPARLASADAQVRQRAAEELAKAATDDDEPLLLELFDDPDPLVREISLRGLQKAGGQNAASALLKLLDDPAPNVRAAVLKELAEHPAPELVEKIAAYAMKEKDPDLVVHAVRFLAGVHGPRSIRCLVGLLAHGQWQIRAEAAEALGKGLNEGNLSDELKAEGYAALLNLMDDPDAFVVSRALQGFHRFEMPEALDRLLRAAEKHQELTPTVIEMLLGDQRHAKRMPKHLRKFAKSARPDVRAAAIRGLVQIEGTDASVEILAALDDADSAVRIAAANALVAHLMGKHSARRSVREIEFISAPAAPSKSWIVRLLETATGPRPKLPAVKVAEDPGEAKPSEEQSPDAAILAAYQRNTKPEWAKDAVVRLERMRSAPAADERFSAAATLILLGKVDPSLAVVLEVAKARSERVADAATLLPYLVWEKRKAAFETLRSAAPDVSAQGALVEGMATVRDARAAELLWQWLGETKLAEDVAWALAAGLRQFVSAENRYSTLKPAEARRAAALAKPWVDRPPPIRRLVALALLAEGDADAARPVAQQLLDDKNMEEAIRHDAFQVLLLLAPGKERTRMAVAALSAEPFKHKVALDLLVNGPQAIWSLREHRYTIHLPESERYYSRASGEIPKLPEGLKPEVLRPLLEVKDPEVQAHAGYLLALAGKPEGLEHLVRLWQKKERKSSDVTRLLSVAIASLDDAKQLPLLRKIYEGLREYEVREFYWTIRSMSGPEMLKFRKEIRQKVGIERLR